MRFVIYGPGAIGGVVGAQLAHERHDVVLIARGTHYQALRTGGLRFESPDEVLHFTLPVVDHPAKIEWQQDDVVLLAMKTQDTAAALDELALAAPPTVAVVSMQNGVANERMALRRFVRTYGIFVYCAAGHLAPGVVQGFSSPTSGILDIGRYPSGVDAFCEEAASAFRKSHFESEVRADVMRWKYRKLLMNLGNAVDALCGVTPRRSDLVQRARDEGEKCLKAAGISFVSEDENPGVRERQLQVRDIGGQQRPGGSSWQSLARQTHTIETDFLNGEIALVGRLHGVDTPVNELLQRLSRQAAAEGRAPGSMTVEAIAAMLKA